MKQLKAPDHVDYTSVDHPIIFVGGSIEMGKAVDWQTDLFNNLSDVTGTLLNPRRSIWDSSWEQKITNPQFKEQVDWELDGLENSDIIVFYFDPNTKSPITLMELGLHATSKKVVVCCPEGFWRKGNVDIVCDRYGIDQVNDFKELEDYIRKNAK